MQRAHCPRIESSVEFTEASLRLSIAIDLD